MTLAALVSVAPACSASGAAASLGAKRAAGDRRALRANARPSFRGGRSTRGCTTTKAVLEVTGDQFKTEVLESDVPVLVDFWATWCGPCKLISKVVEKAEQEFPADKLKIVKIEVDPNPDLVEEFAVYGLPTIALFKDGKMVEGSKREGAINLPKLKDHLDGFGISV